MVLGSPMLEKQAEQSIAEINSRVISTKAQIFDIFALDGCEPAAINTG